MTAAEHSADAELTFPTGAAAARGRVRTLLDRHLPLLVGPPQGVEGANGAHEAAAAEGAAGMERIFTDVLLVTSELVTNAIRHGGGLTGFAAIVEDGCVHLIVSDASDQPPVRSPVAMTGQPGGYGWPLVCSVSEDVTVTPHPEGGKTINARVRLV
ncbi:ATP-binding protein [Streptomyces sp. NBC_01190]|uniref:ATP-binding protein n=1 Tax=Streptomyces sp. NBC_01190 TaxID=2903767 RepID=UPI003868E585|nr:ATP-binding protein [Streptomyces sp. NBC_01190]